MFNTNQVQVKLKMNIQGTLSTVVSISLFPPIVLENLFGFSSNVNCSKASSRLRVTQKRIKA